MSGVRDKKFLRVHVGSTVNGKERKKIVVWQILPKNSS